MGRRGVMRRLTSLGDTMPKPKNKITFELLRKDTAFVAAVLAQEVNRLIQTNGLTRKEVAICDGVLRALRHATHVVIYDSNTLPED